MDKKSKYYTIFIATFCVISLLYILQFYRFNIPANDDYGYIAYNAVFGSPFDIAVDIYKSWNGRLVANFFYSLFLPTLNFDSYRIITAICFLSFCLFFIILAGAINLNTSLKNKIYISLLLLVSICISTTYMHDIFFWMGGVTNHFLPVIFLTGAYICVVKKTERYALRVLWAVASIILVILSSMCSESFSLNAIWFSFILTCLFVFKKDKYRAGMTAIFTIILIAGFVVMYIAPGNAMREAGGNVENARNLTWALWRSLMVALERSGEWLLISQIIPAAILADIALKDIKLPTLSEKISLKTQGILLVIFGVTCVWAAHFTVAYAMGGGGLPGRGKFVPQYFLQILSFAGFICISRSLKLNEKSKTFAIATILFVLMIIPSKHFAPSLMYIGNFSDYYNVLRDRHKYLLMTNEDIVIFAAHPKAPPIINYAFFKSDCVQGDLVSSSLQDYYGKTCIKLDGRHDGYKNYPTLWRLFGRRW